jgi:hypothetical protein
MTKKLISSDKAHLDGGTCAEYTKGNKDLLKEGSFKLWLCWWRLAIKTAILIDIILYKISGEEDADYCARVTEERSILARLRIQRCTRIEMRPHARGEMEKGCEMI